MTEADAGALMASASRECSRQVDPPQIRRILATYHALAASQQEVERLARDWDVVREKHDALLAENVALRAQLTAAREDSARWQFARSRGVILFDQRQRRDTFLFDKVADAALDTARSTDAERTHGETP